MLHSSERWEQIENLFHESLDLPVDARAAFLTQRCGTDLELRNEIEALLESADKPLDVLEQHVMEAARELAAGPEGNLIQPGECIGHYEVVSFTGAGGMGQVYLARDTVLKRKVAIKVLAPALARDQRGLRRFEQEARAASALNHPNILTIYEFGQVNGLQFIASEFVEGLTLRQKLAEGSLSLSTAVDFAIQIATALDAAHASGIVHRDIKPENVMIRTDGLVKVLDFGIAKLNEGQSQQTVLPPALALSLSISMAGLVIGSARYMSPEQARGQPVDARSDIFSLGVVLYEMVAGKAPFEGQTVSDVIAEILKATPQSLSEIVPDTPAALQEIVGTAMCKVRECRYPNAKAMIADLQEFAHQMQVRAGTRGNGQAWPARAGSGEPHATPSANSDSVAQRPWYSMPWLVIGLALLVIAAPAIYLDVHFRKSAAAVTQVHPRTLAILPFHNLREDPTLDYLGFSLSDAIITELSSVNGLTVRPSSSVEKYRGQSADPRKIADQLNVDTLLTGGFIKDGNDLRITTQLIDVKANRILWRDSMDVKYDKLLTVQDRVSQEIVKGLELNLSPQQAQKLHPAKPESPLAYEYYLRGVDLYALSDFPAAIAMLEKSASIDPDYALTWAHLGKAYTTNATLRLGGREQYDKAQAAYEKAMALNPDLVEPRIYMANMLTDTGRVEQAVPLLREALASNANNAELHWELGYAYRFAGMLPESVAECERARQIDPEVKINSSAMNAYLYLGEYAKFLDSLPNQDTAYVLFYRGLGEFYENRSQEAAQDFNRSYMLQPSLLPARVGKALSESIAGRHEAALQMLRQTQDEMEERGVSDAESMYKVAEAYGVLGDQHAALHALSHTIEGGFFCDACFETDPLLSGIRNEGEFQRLVEEARHRHEEFKARFF